MSARNESITSTTVLPYLLPVKEALEGDHGADQQRLATVCMDLVSVLIMKNRDYGCSVWHRPTLAPECDPGVAIRVRMSDKIARLTELYNRESGPCVSESIDDTMLDLAGYIILELARPGR
jgi:hypothetical protein